MKRRSQTSKGIISAVVLFVIGSCYLVYIKSDFRKEKKEELENDSTYNPTEFITLDNVENEEYGFAGGKEDSLEKAFSLDNEELELTSNISTRPTEEKAISVPATKTIINEYHNEYNHYHKTEKVIEKVLEKEHPPTEIVVNNSTAKKEESFFNSYKKTDATPYEAQNIVTCTFYGDQKLRIGDNVKLKLEEKTKVVNSLLSKGTIFQASLSEHDKRLIISGSLISGQHCHFTVLDDSGTTGIKLSKNTFGQYTFGNGVSVQLRIN